MNESSSCDTGYAAFSFFGGLGFEGTVQGRVFLPRDIFSHALIWEYVFARNHAESRQGLLSVFQVIKALTRGFRFTCTVRGTLKAGGLQIRMEQL